MPATATVKDEPTKSTDVPSGFIGHLDVRYLDGHSWELLTEFVYCSPLLQTCIRCPSGLWTDFASIPPALWWLLSPTDYRIGPAAVVHDTLYRRPEFTVTRDEADRVLVEAMGLLGAPAWMRSLVYSALRAFGQGFVPRKP